MNREEFQEYELALQEKLDQSAEKEKVLNKSVEARADARQQAVQDMYADREKATQARHEDVMEATQARHEDTQEQLNLHEKEVLEALMAKEKAADAREARASRVQDARNVAIMAMTFVNNGSGLEDAVGQAAEIFQMSKDALDPEKGWVYRCEEWAIGAIEQLHDKEDSDE